MNYRKKQRLLNLIKQYKKLNQNVNLKSLNWKCLVNANNSLGDTSIGAIIFIFAEAQNQQYNGYIFHPKKNNGKWTVVIEQILKQQGEGRQIYSKKFNTFEQAIADLRKVTGFKILLKIS